MFLILNVLLVLAISTDAISSEPQNGTESSGIHKHLKYINKCCPVGQYVGKMKTCVNYNQTLTFSNIKVYDEKMEYIGKSIEDVFDFKPQKFIDDSFRTEALDVTMLDFNIYVTESGVLQLELPNTYNRWNPIPPGNYCVDYRIIAKKVTTTPRFWVVVPVDELAQSNPSVTTYTIISCVFMLLVLVVYLLLPELRNLCGMIVMAYVASLFMAFLLLTIIQIQLHYESACIGLTMGIYFFFLSSFCWMSVMSYDIWWTHRSYTKARTIHRRGECFKFLMYCLYAWGVPLAMTVGLFVLNTYRNDMRHVPWLVTPHVPDYGCFLEGGVKLLYLYIPMLISILFNCIFIMMAAFHIWRLNRETTVLDSADADNPQTSHTQWHRLKVYLQLSVLMGLNWLFEIASYEYPGVTIWYITDVFNALIGVTIFVILICKKEILKKLLSKLNVTNSQVSATLQSKVSSVPNGLNEQAMDSKI